MRRIIYTLLGNNTHTHGESKRVHGFFLKIKEMKKILRLKPQNTNKKTFGEEKGREEGRKRPPALFEEDLQLFWKKTTSSTGRRLATLLGED